MSTLRYIETANLPEGFDVGDLVAQGVSRQQFIDWCKARVREGNVPPESPPAAVPAQEKAPTERGLPGPGASSTGEVSDRPERPTLTAVPSSPIDTAAHGNLAVLPLPARQPKPEPDEVMLPPEYSDDALARCFTAEHAGEFLYVAAWGRWERWDGARWIHDEKGQAQHAARMVLREQANEILRREYEFKAKTRGMATSVSSVRAVNAVISLARTDPRHSASPNQFDADQWALNTPGGIVDLRTGLMRDPVASDYCTKVTEVTPAGDCPTWLSFLDSVTAGDKDLQQYLQRVAGYSLTGSTAEQAFFFFYGTGQNGKGTFLNMLEWIVGDYSKVASMETFTESKNDRHPTELAALQGARMVTSQETDEGRRWAEARIKSLTGGDPITARFMNKDSFTYQPQFKLLISGNHRPGLRNIDPAMRRRVHLVPFDVTIPAEKRDNNLGGKLRMEAPGILAWAIDGCKEWQRIGLAAPYRVASATDEYFASQDTIGQWLEDDAVVGFGLRCSIPEAYRRFSAHARHAGEYVVPQKRWLDALTIKGISQVKTRNTRMLEGMRLKNAMDDDWSESFGEPSGIL